MPAQTCQLGWHQCSDSWFGTRSGRQHCERVSASVFSCVALFKPRPAGVQSWWYGRLGKQEIVGPSRLISPPSPHYQLLWAWDGCLVGQVEGMDFGARLYMYCVWVRVESS